MSKLEEFEKLTENIFNVLRNNPAYEGIKHNVNIESGYGLRQIDVLIT